MSSKQVFLAVVFFCATLAAYGQSSKDVAPPTPPAPRYQAKKDKKVSVAKIFKKKPKSDREVFEERMKEVAKQKDKEARLAKKPRYSNPLYFGHKKPPKKRPLHKRKLCKTCNIVH